MPRLPLVTLLLGAAVLSACGEPQVIRAVNGDTNTSRQEQDEDAGSTSPANTDDGGASATPAPSVDAGAAVDGTSSNSDAGDADGAGADSGDSGADPSADAGDAGAPDNADGDVSAADSSPGDSGPADSSDASATDSGGDGGTTDTGPGDSETTDSGGGPPARTVSSCYKEKNPPGSAPGPNYDQFNPIVGSHCLGTNHQDIQGVERLVFLGDSVTVGTPPTYTKGYRFVLGDWAKQKWGLKGADIDNCSNWGDRTDDLLLPPKEQIKKCFPGPEPKKTLIVMTVGGNDFAAMAKKGTSGAPKEEIFKMVDHAVKLLGEAIAHLRDPKNFPNGSYIIFANNYEFTDGTGDLESCPTAKLAGFAGKWPEGRDPAIRFNEQYMKLAVETKTDMIFMLEHFCGHGFFHDDPKNQCYKAGNERWFDLTCIHPNPTGHNVIAKMFQAVIEE
ncbi:MAG: hypothetical protein GMKNLPBB_00492 [Myxococcota bacterium]|nr:hypothetical protein [Myxococcota bacterium]